MWVTLVRPTSVLELIWRTSDLFIDRCVCGMENDITCGTSVFSQQAQTIAKDTGTTSLMDVALVLQQKIMMPFIAVSGVLFFVSIVLVEILLSVHAKVYRPIPLGQQPSMEVIAKRKSTASGIRLAVMSSVWMAPAFALTASATLFPLGGGLRFLLNLKMGDFKIQLGHASKVLHIVINTMEIFFAILVTMMWRAPDPTGPRRASLVFSHPMMRKVTLE